MPTLPTLILWILAAAAAFYLLAVLYVFFFQRRLIYVPNRTLWRTPADAGLPHEEVFLETADAVRIHGWFIPCRAAQGTVLFFHGNAGNIAYQIDTAEMGSRWGLNTFMIDYHGYGKSGGKPSESATRLDADAAWDFLVNQKKIPPEKIVLFGRSLGAAVAADLAARVQPGALILESGFSTLADVGASIYPWLPVRLLNRHHYPTIDNAAQFRCPVLVAHSRDDELIPFEHGERVFAAAPEPKTFFEMTGGHGDGFTVTGTAYEEALKNFVYESLLIPTAKSRG